MINENTFIVCPYCEGQGEWTAECCGGQSGCSCGGNPVNMGVCNVCHGRGRVVPGAFDPKANLRMIEGYGFIGDGGNSTINVPRMHRI